MNIDDIKTSTKQLELMKHTIGYSSDKIKGRKNRKYEAFRNHFVISETSDSFDILNELVDLKLMNRRIDPFCENRYIFHVTDFGMEYMQTILDVAITEVD